MNRFYLYVLGFSALFLCACDLQPKIASIPDSVGMFIEDRYPALLADPQSQPEIYNSAVTDYGVYASPELDTSAKFEDYVLYASIDDYVLVPEKEEIKTDDTELVLISVPEKKQKEIVVKENAEENETDEEEIMSEYLLIPEYSKKEDVDKISDEKPVPKQETKSETIQTKEVEKSNEKTSLDKDIVIVERGDTLYSLARKNNTTVAELAKINSLKEPYTLSVGQKIMLRAAKTETKKTEVQKQKSEDVVKPIKVASEPKIQKPTIKETVKTTETRRVDLQEITVVKGDTLYSLSRKYEIPVNDLAVMNKLSAPFSLSVGQKLKVPRLETVQKRSAIVVKKSEAQKTVAQKSEKTKIEKVKADTTKTAQASQTKNTKKAGTKTVEKKSETQLKAEQKLKTNSEPKNTSTKIVARSSSKFSWPVRGKILSGYGPKNNGLVNDGINISAALGTVVKAAENGVVAYAGNEVRGMGNLIIIQHSDGWMTVYAHLNSMDVRRGAKVNVGQPIGKIGKTGKVDKPQLHFEIRKGKKSYNPTNYLKK